jgi:translation initiation factor RLI1
MVGRLSVFHHLGIRHFHDARTMCELSGIHTQTVVAAVSRDADLFVADFSECLVVP